MSMSLDSWFLLLFLLIKVNIKFEEPDYTMIKNILMKNITLTVTEYQLQKAYFWGMFLFIFGVENLVWKLAYRNEQWNNLSLHSQLHIVLFLFE